jgi:hypothetical protein
VLLLLLLLLLLAVLLPTPGMTVSQAVEYC